MPDAVDYPFRFDAAGGVANAAPDDHVRDLIYQVLFTAPGERVNRPDFGCGLRQLVFMPNSDALAAATQFVVQGALERWLAGVIQVQFVDIEVADEVLTVRVGYVRRDTGERQEDRFTAS